MSGTVKVSLVSSISFETLEKFTKVRNQKIDAHEIDCYLNSIIAESNPKKAPERPHAEQIAASFSNLRYLLMRAAGKAPDFQQ